MPAETYKPKRILRMTAPYMTGDDVKIIQRRLPDRLLVDGVYGPATGAAVAIWKRRVGFPASDINTGMGIVAQETMFGQRPRTWAMKMRTINRARRDARERKKILAQRGVGIRTVEDYGRLVGITERPSGSNSVPELAEIARRLGLSTWWQKMGWPWCAYIAFLLALKNGSLAAEAGMRKGLFNALYTPDILHHARLGNHHMRIVGASQAEPGDFVMINFPALHPEVDHMGVVRTKPAGGQVETYEGNTSGTGSQDNGGMILAKTRPLNIVSAFIRFE